MSKKTPESYVKAAVIEYLKLRKVFFLRLNSGSMIVESKGKQRRIAMGEKGTADLLVFVPDELECLENSRAYWLECKAEGGKQTPAQKEFQKRVEQEGHRYLIVRSVDDVKEAGL